MLGRGRFIQGKMPRTTGTSKGSDDGDAEGVAAAGNGKSPPLPLGASLEQLNRKHSNSMLSPYAAAQLRVGEGGGGDGYALELQSDCGESVSSMNDSIYFGGGASVTGGYSRRFHSNSNRNSPMLLQKAKSLAVGIVPGTSPDLPINLLGPMHDETSDIRSLESGSRAAFTATQFSLADMEEYTTPMPQKDGSKDGTTAVSPTSVLVSASSNNSESSPQQKYAGGLCCCCCPGWIRRAPTWLKVVFFLSVVLLLGAVALVVVGLFISLHAEESSSENGSLSQGSENAPLFPVTLSPVEAVGSVAVPVAATTAPTVTPTASPLLVKTSSSTPPILKPAMSNDVKPAPKNPPPPSAAPLVQTAPPSTTVPLVQATVPPTAAPLAQATVPPTAVVPSNDGTLAATVAPTNATQDELKSLLTVYLTAGRYSSALQEQVAATAGSIPDREGTAFMVHLGDWNSPSLTNCNEDTFQQVSNLFLQSSVPVYFVVGDNGTNYLVIAVVPSHVFRAPLFAYQTFYSLVFRQSTTIVPIPARQ